MSIKKIATAFSQYFVGILFIFSGLIKANDPKGFGIKLEEYFQIFAKQFNIIPGLWELLADNADPIAMLLVVFEIFLGIALLVGVYRRFTTWALLSMILFFTALTFYSAYFNAVTDCGCFGDAIKLKPWQSFYKDIILLVLILVLFFNWTRIIPISRSRVTGKRLLYGLTGVSAVLTWICFRFEPIKDFRPYKEGADIYALTRRPVGGEPKYDIIFTYTDTTTNKDTSFSEKVIADPAMGPVLAKYTKFKDRQQTTISEGTPAPINNFAIMRSSQPLTDTFFAQKGYRFVVVAVQLEKADDAALHKISDLMLDIKREQGKANVPDSQRINKQKVWALTSSSEYISTEYVKNQNLAFDFLNMDAVPLKTMMRSNPGLLLFKDNVVVKKWSGRMLPSTETVLEIMKSKP